MKRLAVLFALLLATPAAAQTWQPPMVLWTHAHPGFYFGPYYFSDAMPLTTFLARFGHNERTLTDAFGLKHMYFFSRGVELVATQEGKILSFTFYTQPTPAMQGYGFKPALIQTNTGLGPGNTWNDVWLVQGAPQRQKVDEQGDKLYVLEYHLDGSHDLDFFFKGKGSAEKIFKLGIYPRI